MTHLTLDPFTRAYIAALFFTDGDYLPDADDLAPQAIAKIKKDCEDFQTRYSDDLERAYALDDLGYTEAQAGHDFWLTRQGHGAGFWDKKALGGLAQRLTDAAKTFREVAPYVGDDGKVWI